MTLRADTNPNRRLGIVISPDGKITLYTIGSKPVPCPLKVKVL